MAELRAYNPSLRDRLGAIIAGDSKPGEMRNDLANGLVGSAGANAGGTGLVDFTPAGIPLNAYDAGNKGASGNFAGAAASAMGAIPALNAESPAVKKIIGYLIKDGHTGEIMSDAYGVAQRSRARARVDKLDNAYGAYRYRASPIWEDGTHGWGEQAKPVPQSMMDKLLGTSKPSTLPEVLGDVSAANSADVKAMRDMGGNK